MGFDRLPPVLPVVFNFAPVLRVFLILRRFCVFFILLGVVDLKSELYNRQVV